MVVQWMRDVVDVAEVRRISDGVLLAPLDLPTIGTMSGITTEPRRVSTEFWFSMTSFLEPSAKYRADAAALAHTGAAGASPQVELFHRTELKVPHNPDEFVMKQVFVKSKDGTRVPMFVVHHQDVTMDGSNPTLLYGYGGFNISLQPSFSASRCAFSLFSLSCATCTPSCLPRACAGSGTPCQASEVACAVHTNLPS